MQTDATEAELLNISNTQTHCLHCEVPSLLQYFNILNAIRQQRTKPPTTKRNYLYAYLRPNKSNLMVSRRRGWQILGSADVKIAGSMTSAAAAADGSATAPPRRVTAVATPKHHINRF